MDDAEFFRVYTEKNTIGDVLGAYKELLELLNKVPEQIWEGIAGETEEASFQMVERLLVVAMLAAEAFRTLAKEARTVYEFKKLAKGMMGKDEKSVSVSDTK